LVGLLGTILVGGVILHFAKVPAKLAFRLLGCLTVGYVMVTSYLEWGSIWIELGMAIGTALGWWLLDRTDPKSIGNWGVPASLFACAVIAALCEGGLLNETVPPVGFASALFLTAAAFTVVRPHMMNRLELATRAHPNWRIPKAPENERPAGA
jgi:hypothetical protein